MRVARLVAGSAVVAVVVGTGLPARAALFGGLDETVPNEAALRSNPDLTRVGQLVVDAEGNGSLGFRVPDIRPGLYQLFVLCRTCAPFSAGRSLISVAEFRVTDPSGRYRRVTVTWILIAGGIMAALVLWTAAWEQGVITLVIGDWPTRRRAKDVA
jgi:hypothetical protein